MTDLVIVVVLALICGAAIRYIYKAKKSGAKCIGCAAGKSCGGSCGVPAAAAEQTMAGRRQTAKIDRMCESAGEAGN